MDTDAIRRQLNTRRNELLQRVNRLDKDVSHRDEPYDRDGAEQAIELENLDVLMRLDEEGRAELKQVNAALMRLDSGNYGLCAECGEAIAPERLAALPSTTTCIDCAKA